jgi:hypothetical protein
MRRLALRRAVLELDHPAAGQGADLDVLTGENGDHAGRGLRLRRVDGAQRRVRVRAAQIVGMGLVRTIDVVDVISLAGEEAEIFLAAYRRANPRVRHQRPPAIASAPALIALTML